MGAAGTIVPTVGGTIATIGTVGTVGPTSEDLEEGSGDLTISGSG